jgi:hypothetical protein
MLQDPDIVRECRVIQPWPLDSINPAITGFIQRNITTSRRRASRPSTDRSQDNHPDSSSTRHRSKISRRAPGVTTFSRPVQGRTRRKSSTPAPGTQGRAGQDHFLGRRWPSNVRKSREVRRAPEAFACSAGRPHFSRRLSERAVRTSRRASRSPVVEEVIAGRRPLPRRVRLPGTRASKRVSPIVGPARR